MVPVLKACREREREIERGRCNAIDDVAAVLC